MSQSSDMPSFTAYQKDTRIPSSAQKDQFENHNSEILSYMRSQGESIKDLDGPIQISKNDSMKRRVEQILEKLKTNHVLIVARANSIPKMISIVEIAKQVVRKQDKDAKIKQYNKVSQHKSLVNPNYKQSKQASAIGSAKLPDTQESDEYDRTLEQIRGEKVYQLQDMHILLVKGGDVVLNMSGWTYQDV